MPESFGLRKRMPYVSAFLLTIVLILLLEFLGFFKAVNSHAYDLFFRIRGAREPSNKIIIAEIDERTLRELGRWPISRKYYAELLGRLEFADVVGLDIILAEPSEDDVRLATSIQKLKKVVLAAYLNERGEIIYPTRILYAAKTGHVHVEMDADGVARNIYHTLGSGGVSLSSFASAIYESKGNPAPHFAGQADQPCIPGIIQSNPMMVNFYGPSGTFRRIPFYDILIGKFPPELFRDTIVLVGATALGIENGLVIPFTSARNRMPGVEFHANVLGNMLDDSFIGPVEAWVPYLGMIVLTGLFFVLFPFRPAIAAFSICVSALLALAISIYVLLVRAYIWIPPGGLWASIAVPFLVCSTLELKRTYQSLVQARRNWEEAFDTIDDAICIQDRTGDFVRTNKAGRLILGDFLLQVMKQRYIKHVHRSGATLSEDAGNEPVQAEELFDAAASRHYEVKSLRRNVRGEFGGLVHVVRDITLKKQAQEEQEMLQKMLIQAQKMESLGTLASGIAHDFNNILTAVFGYTELVLHGLPAEEKSIRPRLEQVLKASHRARELIAQILTFSRRTVAERCATRVVPVVKEALKLFRAGIPSSVTLTESFDVDCDVEIDATHMHQIVLNLCTNAYHALKGAGGTIQVSLTNMRLEHPVYKYGQELRPGAYVELTVTDTGCGIPEEHVDKVFEPYFTTKAEGQGTGLGLAIIQAIAQEHGGVITLESVRGQGTSFHIYLPQASLPGASEAVESGEAVTGSGRILLIEDDPQTCALVKEMLEGFGYSVESKTNAREALDLFTSRAQSFDLVMTDFDMPLMSGIELAEKLLVVRPDTPILLCTGYLDQSLSEKAKAAGIREVVRKPFDSKRLSRSLAASITR